jgi:hypothetical protein
VDGSAEGSTKQTGDQVCGHEDRVYGASAEKKEVGEMVRATLRRRQQPVPFARASEAPTAVHIACHSGAKEKSAAAAAPT